MGKKLSEMSLKELWQLFPIFLTEYQTSWKEWYSEEEIFLKKTIPQVVRISHIGSTAIGSILAKPIIDILVEVPKESILSNYRDLLENSGYICMAQNANNISFNKGYTENGFAEKVFHIHLRYWGDNDEVYFRDYMNSNPILAKEYEEQKLTFWKLYEHDRDGYTDAKHGFVSEYTQKAKEEYKR